MPTYIDDPKELENIPTANLQGFFGGWSNPPSAETLKRLLTVSSYAIVAVEEENQQIIGYATALSDCILHAYISELEVLPPYQEEGVGQELMRRVIQHFANIYAIDLVCEPELEDFYGKAGMRAISGMVIRNENHQSDCPKS